MKRLNKKIRPIHLILIIMGALTFIKFITLYAGWGDYFNSLIWAFNERTLFYDHFDHIKYCLLGNVKDVYWVNVNACFPAFAYFFYGFLAHLCAVDQIDVTEYAHVFNTNSGILTLVFVYSVFLITIALLLYKFFNNSFGETVSLLLVFLILFSSIFLMTIASGNLTIGAMLLTLLSLYFRDSKSQVLREISMISLACAASLKIYPAVWGVLYLKEKRFKEAGRLIFYGLFVFLAPFASFGGIAGFIQFVKNIAQVSKIVTGIALVGVLQKFFSIFMDGELAVTIARVIDYIYLLLTFLLVFLKKKIDWKTYVMLAGAMFIFNPESGSYCMIYWTIALVAYVVEIGNKSDATILEMIYAVFFAFSFSALPILGLGSSVIPATFLYGIIIMVMIEGIIEVVENIMHAK